MRPLSPQQEPRPFRPAEEHGKPYPLLEFEEAMKFSMDGSQRQAHAEKMKAESEQIRANARKTNAEAKSLEQRNWISRLQIAGVYAGTASVIFVAGFVLGALLFRI